MDINVSTIIFPLRAKLSQQGYWMKHSDVTTCVAVHIKGTVKRIWESTMTNIKIIRGTEYEKLAGNLFWSELYHVLTVSSKTWTEQTSKETKPHKGHKELSKGCNLFVFWGSLLC